MERIVSETPGFVAYTAAVPGVAQRLAVHAAEHLAGHVIELDELSAAVIWPASVDVDRPQPWQLVLGTMARTHARALDAQDIRALLVGGPGDGLLADVVPPFGAVGWDPAGRAVTAVTDWLGFRHVYVAAGEAWSGVSSSAALLADCLGARLDREALMIQSLVGWQIADRSLYAGVRKLRPGTRVRLRGGALHEMVVVQRDVRTAPSPDTPERAAADAVRESIARFFDDHDGALLQLTGGLDSRILLACIPRQRRTQIEALTLAVPGSPDLSIARRLAVENGMRHRIITLDGLGDLPAAAVFDLVAQCARRVEGMADPLAVAALCWAERDLAGRPRLAGLGGEVARGFYYFFPQVRLPVRPWLSAALARWRVFPNESVQRDALLPEFESECRVVATAAVHESLRAVGTAWWPATDEFYLWQRMQRWAGTLASATAFDRSTLNPMLSRRFIDTARALPPLRKHNMRYLSRICLEADASLADIELDGRPAPRAYAEPSWANRWRLGRTQAAKVVRKATQRASRASRPPAGGDVVAAKVLEHWRTAPEDLQALLHEDVFNPTWLDQVAAGVIEPTPSTVAFMVNLSHATQVRRSQLGSSESLAPASAGLWLGRSSARMAARDR